jgi:ATP-dependent Clp protease ATP-binding subunit ClpA
MFERFDEPARRTLFFAFHAANESGATHIEPEHVVLGILRSDPVVLARFTSDEAIAGLRTRLESSKPGGPKNAGEQGIPFSEATIAAIEWAVVEADDLHNRDIRSEHLLLRVLVKTAGYASESLHAASVRVAAIREFLQGLP